MPVPRAIRQVVPTRKQLEGGGFTVRRPPFDNLGGLILLFDHMQHTLRPGEDFPSPDHPHRGFSTVSYLLQGALEHHCSSGHSAVNFPGHVQWMIAGKGVVHGGNSEAAFKKSGGGVEGFQIWINLPGSLKFVPPNYFELPAEKVPVFASPESGASVKVIAGKHGDVEAALSPLIPVSMMDIRLQPGGNVTLDVPKGQIGMVYAFRGAGKFGSQNTEIKEGIVGILGDGDTLEIKADTDATLVDVPAPHSDPSKGFEKAALAALVVFGEPINEPVVRQGPFVLNTREQLHQAFEDYYSGKMGRESRVKFEPSAHEEL